MGYGTVETIPSGVAIWKDYISVIWNRTNDKETLSLMDDQTIINLFEIQKKDLKEIIEENGVVIRGLMRSEVNRIDEMDQKRNGAIRDLLCETTVWRWAQRNYKFVLPAALFILILIIKGSDRIDVNALFENTTGIELTDE